MENKELSNINKKRFFMKEPDLQTFSMKNPANYECTVS